MRHPSYEFSIPPVNRNSFRKIPVSISLVAALLAGAAPRGIGAQTPGWQEETRLTFDEGTSTTAPNNAKYLALDGDGRLHVVWLDDRNRNFEIYHRVKSGGVWSPEERLTFAEGTSARPNLAADASGVIHLVWNDDRSGNMEIYHRFWAFGAWSRESRVTDTPGDSFASALTAVGDTVHMVYMETIGGMTQIMHRSFKNMAWSAATPLTAAATGGRLVPTIDRGPDGSLHVAWWDTRTDELGDCSRIYYRTRAGSVWLPEELLTDPTMSAMRPSIAVDESLLVHVAWIDLRAGYEQIYYRRRGPAGWEGETALTNEPCTHYHPSIDTSGDDVLVAYWDTHVADFNSEVFFKRRTNGVWWGPERISAGEGTSDLCCLIAGPNGAVHIAWVDTRDGNREIYYREYIDPATSVGGDGDDGGETATPPPPFSVSAFPNPFRESTRVVVSAGEPREASIDIYGVDGRRVRSLARTMLAAGVNDLLWDGADDAGAPLAPGLYIAVARMGKVRASAKILRLR